MRSPVLLWGALAVLTALGAGCQSHQGVVADPVAGDTLAPGDLPPLTLEPDREVQGLRFGLVALGPESNPGLYEDPPWTITQPANAGDLLMVKVRATTIPVVLDNAPLIEVTGTSGPIGAANILTDGTWVYLPYTVTASEPVSITLYNSSGTNTGFYDEAVEWEYYFRLFPREAPGERNDDDTRSSIADRFRSKEVPLGYSAPGHMYYLDDANRDIEDWYFFRAIGGEQLTLDFLNSNGEWADWRFSLSLFSADGQLLAEQPGITNTSGQLGLELPGSGEQTFYLQVAGSSESQAGPGASFVQYVWRAVAALEPPTIVDVTPTSGIEQFPATFSATTAGGAITDWAWDFGGGADPNTSTEAAPAVTFGAPGSYAASLVVSNGAGSDRRDFTLDVIVGQAPALTAIGLSQNFARRPTTFTVGNAGHPGTSWSWDFGGGAIPNTSTDESPAVQAWLAGTYSGSVMATNPFGSSSLTFDYTIVNKMLGLSIIRIDADGVPPTQWWNLAGWDLESMRDWFETYINPAYWNAGVQFQRDRITMEVLNRPDLYNDDNEADDLAIFTLALAHGMPGQQNLVIINNNLYSGWAGVMWDAHCYRGLTCNDSCLQDNLNRGCIVISYNTDFQTYLVGHELGHVFALPHIRTAGPPTPANDNLMSYGIVSMKLEENITREAGASCHTNYWDNPMNQLQTANDWSHSTLQ